MQLNIWIGHAVLWACSLGKHKDNPKSQNIVQFPNENEVIIHWQQPSSLHAFKHNSYLHVFNWYFLMNMNSTPVPAFWPEVEVSLFQTLFFLLVQPTKMSLRLWERQPKVTIHSETSCWRHNVTYGKSRAWQRCRMMCQAKVSKIIWHRYTAAVLA